MEVGIPSTDVQRIGPRIEHNIAQANGRTDGVDNVKLFCGSCYCSKVDRGMEYLQVTLQIR